MEKRKKINKRTNVDEQQHKGKKYHFRNGGGGLKNMISGGNIYPCFPHKMKFIPTEQTFFRAYDTSDNAINIIFAKIKILH